MASTVMCTAAARLSRRRAWHSSCARIDRNWAGDKRSKIPSGSSNTGLKIPKTPGSRGTGEDITLSGMSSDTGDAARTAARMFLHRLNHATATAVNPQIQIPSRTADIKLAAGITVASGADRANGWLICSIVIGNGDCVTDAV